MTRKLYMFLISGIFLGAVPGMSLADSLSKSASCGPDASAAAPEAGPLGTGALPGPQSGGSSGFLPDIESNPDMTQGSMQPGGTDISEPVGTGAVPGSGAANDPAAGSGVSAPSPGIPGMEGKDKRLEYDTRGTGALPDAGTGGSRTDSPGAGGADAWTGSDPGGTGNVPAPGTNPDSLTFPDTQSDPSASGSVESPGGEMDTWSGSDPVGTGALPESEPEEPAFLYSPDMGSVPSDSGTETVHRSDVIDEGSI